MWLEHVQKALVVRLKPTSGVWWGGQASARGVQRGDWPVWAEGRVASPRHHGAAVIPSWSSSHAVLTATLWSMVLERSSLCR